MINESHLLSALTHGYEGYISNGHLSVNDLPQYANQLREDLEWINLHEFEILPLVRLPAIVNGIEYTVPIASYKFGEYRNSVDNASPDESKENLLSLKNIEGTGVNCEDLRWLCDLLRDSRRALPHMWLKDERLRKNLLTRHINTLSELFWVTRWTNVNSNLTLHENCIVQKQGAKSVDWTLSLNENNGSLRVINLEVKNLTSSLEIALFKDSLRVDDFVSNSMRGLQDKFPLIVNDDINLVCFSTFLNSQKKLRQLALSVLNQYKSVDAVLFWIACGDLDNNWQVYSRELDCFQTCKDSLLRRHFIKPSYLQAKPLIYKHPLWGVLPWQQD